MNGLGLNLLLVMVGAIPVMLILHGLGWRKNNMGWVDVGWSGCLALGVLWMAVVSDGFLPRRLLVSAFMVFWAVRLTSHIYLDRLHQADEDSRYRRLRNHWGARAKRNFLFFYLAQVPLVGLFLLPPALAMAYPHQGWRLADGLGLLIALMAIVGETVADRQLAAWRSNPDNRGRTMRQGLWRYSRHPNYFFEWTHWWAYTALAAGMGGWWLTLLGPVCMFLFLFRVTGIPHVEREALAKRGDDYLSYQQTTSAFFPWLPKKP